MKKIMALLVAVAMIGVMGAVVSGLTPPSCYVCNNDLWITMDSGDIEQFTERFYCHECGAYSCEGCECECELDPNPPTAVTFTILPTVFAFTIMGATAICRPRRKK